VLFGGSHARRTKKWVPAGTSSDVDLYVVLASGQRNKYEGFFGPQTDALLYHIKSTLTNELKTPTIRRGSPCVRVTYADGVLVDVVPCFERGWYRWFYSGLDIPYENKWRTATPEQQGKVFTELNAKRGGLLKPLIKMIKHWRDQHPSLAGFRSYHLETLAYNIFSQRGLTEYRAGVRDFFRDAPTCLRYQWDDPGGSGTSVSDYMSQAARQNATTILTNAARQAEHALSGTQTWEDEINAWRKLFGSRFPTFG
jgi:Second Messenger Oligonucleotide or Dinucleotide Synthetase domain